MFPNPGDRSSTPPPQSPAPAPPFPATITTTYSASPPPPAAPSPPPSSADLLAQFKDQAKTLIAAQRPWPELLNAAAIGVPATPSSAVLRLRLNAAYFRSNYAVAVLAIAAVSLLSHPGSLLLFAALAAAWFFLFFARAGDQAVVVLGRPLDENSVLGFLGVATLAAFLFTDLGGNLFGALVLGFVVVAVHAIFRGTDDLPVEELPMTVPAPARIDAAVTAIGVPAVPQTYVRVG